MKTENVRKPTMISSAEITSLSRSQATELFKDATRKTGSKMLAYERVASAVGVSPGWLRKLINGYEAKEPRATVYENIRARYEEFCRRIEAENTIDELRLMSLRRGPDASIASDGEEISS